MLIIKRITGMTTAFICLSALFLAAPSASATIFSLGDSLSDSGALGFTYTNPDELSASSAGNVWTQYLTNSVPAFCNDPKHCVLDKETYYYSRTGNNYAVGGAGVTFNSTDVPLANSYTSLHYQIQALTHNHRLTKDDVVTVWMGANDILAAFESRKNSVAFVRSAARTFKFEVSRLAKYGAKVYVITIPDLALTPFAQTTLNKADADFLSDLTSVFNRGISGLANVNNVSLVDSNAFYALLMASPEFDNSMIYCAVVIDPAHICGDASTNPEVTPTSNLPFLFADPIHPSNAAHKWIGMTVRKLMNK